MPNNTSIRPVVSIQYRLVTDGRTHDDSKYRVSISSRAKNEMARDNSLNIIHNNKITTTTNNNSNSSNNDNNKKTARNRKTLILIGAFPVKAFPIYAQHYLASTKSS